MSSFKRLVLAALLLAFMAIDQRAFAQQCEQDVFEGSTFSICTVKPGEAELRLFWENAGGEPYRNFSAVAQAVAKDGHALTFAVNAGMYLPDFSPIGLYVEDGRELRPINTRSMTGAPGQIPNFYKTPNGVFFLNDAGAGVLPTDKYLKLRPVVRLATQSGPMLVIDNALNPIFIAGSTDRTRRNGVGVCEGGAVRFAISVDVVNFHDFARLFRDHLHCPDALFLDGGHGVGLYSPELGRNDISWHGGFGPILGVLE